MYGKVFRRPEAHISTAAKVPGIDGQKMSKSYNNTVEIFAEGKELKKSIMAIVTDSTPVADPKDPTHNTIFQLYRLVATTAETAAMQERFLAGGYGYGDAKKALLEKVDSYFAVARERRKDLQKNRDYVEEVLRQGAEKARGVAAKTLQSARKACGID
jgi:tryptophanyl-tRNA synthetase